MTSRRVTAMAAAAAFSAILVGCGSDGSEPDKPTGAEYPLVTPPEPQHLPPVTTPSGAVVQHPVPPTAREEEPSHTCERMLVTYHDGSKPTKRPAIFPPAPGLRAEALSTRRVRVEWWFRSLPDDCRPTLIRLSVTATTATPTGTTEKVSGTSGSAVIEYPDFLPPPRTALASSYSADGRRSRTVKVAIQR